MKPLPISRWEIYNWLYCLAFDGVVYYYYGVWPIVYMFISMVIGLGPHPMAGHFIAERKDEKKMENLFLFLL
jgi:sphingolipid delta-4 desaturase